MNIFAVSTAPYLCAQALDDVRLVKMVLETAQIVCMAAEAGQLPIMRQELLYKPSHQNHPAVRWACASHGNARWTRSLLLSLASEYQHRFDKTHKSSEILSAVGQDIGQVFAPPGQGEFVNCTTLDGPDVHECYRHYLVEKWLADVEADRTPTWRRRGPPDWMERVLWRSSPLSLRLRAA